MTNKYIWVSWNRHKRVYDVLLWLGIIAFLGIFIGVSQVAPPDGHAIDPMVGMIRGLGLAAFTLLHLILAIGPLARLNPRMAPLLYNRRHAGVSMFLLGLGHALLTLLYYGGFGVDNPVSAMLASNGSFTSLSGFPFEILGAVALLIIFAMAATSHDFWLANLSARTWKWLHMLVYVAYVLLVGHVVLGSMQSEPSPAFLGLLAFGAGVLVCLHLAAGVREWRRDRTGSGAEWLDVCAVDEIEDSRAKVVCPANGERIAVFRDGESFSAVSNLCAHQGGPLGEGKLVDGCITCPWHGYQYRPGDGCSPPPYTEKVETYQVRIVDRRVQVSADPNPPGTPVEPARIASEEAR